MICIRKGSGKFRPNYLEEVTVIRTQKILNDVYYVLKEYQFDEDGYEQGFMIQFFREPLDTRAIADEFKEVIEVPEKVKELELV